MHGRRRLYHRVSKPGKDRSVARFLSAAKKPRDHPLISVSLETGSQIEKAALLAKQVRADKKGE